MILILKENSYMAVHASHKKIAIHTTEGKNGVIAVYPITSFTAKIVRPRKTLNCRLLKP